MDVNGTFTDPNGTGIPMKQHMDMTLHQTVQSVRASDGAATLATQIDTLAFAMNGQNIPLPPEAQQRFKQASHVRDDADRQGAVVQDARWGDPARHGLQPVGPPEPARPAGPGGQRQRHLALHVRLRRPSA